VSATPSALKIYPNPVQANGSISVELGQDMQSANIEIFNMRGQLLKTVKPAGLLSSIPLPFPVGIYLIRVKERAAVVAIE
jgi:hypothetical protein